MEAKTVCVLGLGYIGLPTAAMLAIHGHRVIGVDIDERIVTALNQGVSIIEEPYMDNIVHAAVTSGKLTAAAKPAEADVFIICVPTPVTEDKKAEMSCVKAAVDSIVRYVRKGNIVILESTSPVGTTKQLVCPILEKSFLSIGSDLFVAYCPERVLPGKILSELVNNNRIIGGVNRESAELVRDFYKTFVKGDIFLTDTATAEMCKLIENTCRDVNIAFANELALICEKEGINVWEVIELCNKHPRVDILNPGPGVGGHCLAVDPWFIVEKNPKLAEIITLSRKTNDSMPRYIINRIDAILSNIDGTRKVAVFGMTYKPNIDDIRESPVIKLVKLLEQKGIYEIKIYDPHVKGQRYQTSSPVEAARECDLLVLAVRHDEFRSLPLRDMGKVMRSRNIFDTGNFFDRETVVIEGFNYYLLGDGK